MKTRVFYGLGVVALVALLLAGLHLGLNSLPAQAASPGDPLPGTVRGLGGPHTFYNAGSITTTTYTASPLYAQGSEVSSVWLYHSADVFVTADVSGTDKITVTAQTSLDGSNWADLTYTYIAETLAQTTTVLTSTGVTTATSTLASSSVLTEVPYRIVRNSDGTDYLRLPIAGRYLRFKIQTSGTVTPTVRVLLRND